MLQVKTSDMTPYLLAKERQIYELICKIIYQKITLYLFTIKGYIFYQFTDDGLLKITIAIATTCNNIKKRNWIRKRFYLVYTNFLFQVMSDNYTALWHTFRKPSTQLRFYHDKLRCGSPVASTIAKIKNLVSKWQNR